MRAACPCSGEILIHILHSKDKILQSVNTAVDLFAVARASPLAQAGFVKKGSGNEG